MRFSVCISSTGIRAHVPWMYCIGYGYGRPGVTFPTGGTELSGFSVEVLSILRMEIVEKPLPPAGHLYKGIHLHPGVRVSTLMQIYESVGNRYDEGISYLTGVSGTGTGTTRVIPLGIQEIASGRTPSCSVPFMPDVFVSFDQMMLLIADDVVGHASVRALIPAC